MILLKSLKLLVEVISVEQNKKEIEILNAYMPKQLSEEELTEIIDKVFEEVKTYITKKIWDLL